MIDIKSLKKGNYILHRDEPAVVKEVGIVVTGTHSHTKCKLTVQGLFSNFTETIVKSFHEHVDDLDVTRKKAQVISKTAKSVQIMDPVSYETLDAEADEAVFAELHEGDEVTYIHFNNRTKILEKR